MRRSIVASPRLGDRVLSGGCGRDEALSEAGGLERQSVSCNPTQRSVVLFRRDLRLIFQMQFTFKREAVAMAMVLVAPILLGLLVAFLSRLFVG